MLPDARDRLTIRASRRIGRQTRTGPSAYGDERGRDNLTNRRTVAVLHSGNLATLLGSVSLHPEWRPTKRTHPSPMAALRSGQHLATRRASLAFTTVIAVMFTMRRTVAAGVNICADAAQPSSIGPMPTLWPAADFSRL